jgi:hypothetical protein
MEFAISPSGVALPRPRAIVRISPWLPTRYCAENLWSEFDRDQRKLYDRFFKAPSLEEKFNVMRMAGSLANFSSKKLADLLYGATAYTAPTNHYMNLWTATLDDTFNGATTGKAAYTSYAALQLTNNTTIFAAGSGTTTYTKTYPSDAAKSWPTSTGGTSTVTYLADLDGNAGTSADNGLAWCSVTSTTINSGDTPQLAQNAVSYVQD